MIEFLVFGGVWFWIFATILAGALIATIEFDKGFMSCLVIGAIFAFIEWAIPGFSLVDWVWENPWSLVEHVGYYFVIGIIWGIIKWWFYLIKVREVVREFKQEWLAARNIADVTIKNMTSSDRKKFLDDLIHESGEYWDNSYPPSSLQHKLDYLMWATYWPFSMFWTLLNDPIKYAWRFLYAHLGGLLQRMSDRMFRGV